MRKRVLCYIQLTGVAGSAFAFAQSGQRLFFCSLLFFSFQTLASFRDLAASGGCSKLTTSLVNVLLKFKSIILQIRCYFLLEKMFQFFNKK